MAEEDLDLTNGAEEGEGGGGGKSKLLIIIIAAVLVLGGGGFAGWWFFLRPPAKPAEKAKVAEKSKEPAPASTVIKMVPFVVNLADPGGKRYLKLSLALGLKDPKQDKMVQPYIPQIRDSILLLLTSKTYSDIASVAGKIRLRNQILSIINRAVGSKVGIHAVYFTEFVIQ